MEHCLSRCIQTNRSLKEAKLANWNLPTLDTLYTEFLSLVHAKVLQAAKMFNTDPTNGVDGMVKMLRKSNGKIKFQERESGVWEDRLLDVDAGGTGRANDQSVNLSGIGYLFAQVHIPQDEDNVAIEHVQVAGTDPTTSSTEILTLTKSFPVGTYLINAHVAMENDANAGRSYRAGIFDDSTLLYAFGRGLASADPADQDDQDYRSTLYELVVTTAGNRTIKMRATATVAASIKAHRYGTYMIIYRIA